MIKEIFAVFDKKAAVFCLPFYMVNGQMAIRAFVGTIMDKSSEVGKFPDDFELYRLGTFDDETGAFVTNMPVSMGSGSSFGASLLSVSGGSLVKGKNGE